MVRTRAGGGAGRPKQGAAPGPDGARELREAIAGVQRTVIAIAEALDAVEAHLDRLRAALSRAEEQAMQPGEAPGALSPAPGDGTIASRSRVTRLEVMPGARLHAGRRRREPPPGGPPR